MARAAEEARHDPTPRRIADARRRGDIPQSAELRAGLAQAAVIATLIALAPSIVARLRGYFAGALGRAASGEEPAVSVSAAFVSASASALDCAVRVLAAPLAVAFASVLLVGLVQTGGLWVGPPRAALGRLAPRRPWRRGGGASASAAGDTARGLLRTAVLLAVAAVTLGALAPDFVRLAGVTAPRALAALGAIAQRLGVRIAAATVLIGAIEEVWARARHRRGLRMTQRELDQERKESEGDPMRRRERRRLHAEIGARAAALAAVDATDLVVTGDAGDDTPLAVVLRHDRGGDRAPIVVVAARGPEAARVLAVARTAGNPMFADAPLARALAPLASGVEIPPETYERVAEFLHAAGPAHAIVTAGPMPRSAPNS